MINTGLNVKKIFRKKWKMYATTFGAIKQPFIKATLLKNNTSVLELMMFYETRADKIDYRVLSCVIYTKTIVYVFIIQLVNNCFK